MLEIIEIKEDKMKKIDIVKKQFQQFGNIFRCPICNELMDINEMNSLVCVNNHCFDLSRKGYVNLLHKSIHKGYDKRMFNSRIIVSKSGFFEPMMQEVNTLVGQAIYNRTYEKPIMVLDAGCGEGSHLSNIITNRNKCNTNYLNGVGIDISKDGIQVASREYKDIIWCVADLANIPFCDKQFDVIVNIFSPSNYSEFKRVLKENGILIKVIPESNYLIELRSNFYKDTKNQTYSNEEVIKNFSNNFVTTYQKRITYNMSITEDNLLHIINMTPLSWGTDNERIDKVLKKGLRNLTVDVSVIVGKKD